MFLTAQGQNPNKRIDELEKKVQDLENALKALQSGVSKRGRPPKEQNGQFETQVADRSGD